MDTFNSSSALSAGVNAQLPLFNPASPPSFTWGEKEGEEILQTLHSIRDKVVHWEPNLFDIPLGAAGKRFVEENIRLISAFADGSALESASLLALMVLPALTLQRTADSVSLIVRGQPTWTVDLAFGRTVTLKSCSSRDECFKVKGA